MGGYSSKAVANWLLEQFNKTGRDCTQLQMNKLVYIMHGWHLGFNPHGIGLIDEAIEAWKWGPVVPSLRVAFKDYGSSPITTFATARDLKTGHLYNPTLQPKEAWESSLINWVWSRYGSLDAAQLIALTHQPGSPWATVTNNGTDVGYSKPINNEIIQKYYIGLVEQLRNTQGASS